MRYRYAHDRVYRYRSRGNVQPLGTGLLSEASHSSGSHLSSKWLWLALCDAHSEGTNGESKRSKAWQPIQLLLQL